MTQRKFRCPDNEWQAFCNSLPQGVSPSDKLREMVRFCTSPLDYIAGVEEMAETLNVQPEDIENLCKEKLIQAKKIQNTWVISKMQPIPKQP